MLNPVHVRALVVRPALRALEPAVPYSVEAEDIVVETARAESGLVYLRQLGSGPALGLWQMEPATENDCWQNFVFYRPAIGLALRSMLAPGFRAVDQLPWNLLYAAAMCRIKYRRSPDPIPHTTAGRARLWKKWYNTDAGAGTVRHYLDAQTSP